jgi:hypothetical protein
MFYFVATGDNTGAVTLNIDSLGAKAVTRDGSVALAAGDIKSGEVVVVVYDGTRFQVVSQLNSAGDARFANVSIASSLYVGGVSTFVGNAGFSANVSIASALSVGGVAAITGATTIGGNLTLSGGTANGVLYLNGSKVATSGSALTFDGTNFATTGNSRASGQFLAGSTGAATPDFSFIADNTLGIFRAPNAIGFSIAGSEQARLTTTGLGIGTTSPGYKLQVTNTAASNFVSVVSVNTGTAGLLLGDTDSATVGRVEYENLNNAMTFYTNGSERARIDSSGNLGIGTTNPSNKFVVSNAGAAGLEISPTGTASNPTVLSFNRSTSAYGQLTLASDFLVFMTNGTNERARITSGGYSKFSNDGTYYGSAASYHELRQTGTGVGAVVSASNASYANDILYVTASRNTTNGTFNYFVCYNDGSANFRLKIADSGNVTNVNGSYGTISDAKMKTDIVDAGSQWDDLKAVRFRKFKMKDDPQQITQLGVVAQELEQTSPGLVDEHADRDAEGNDLGTTTKSVKSSILLMKAAVALQEAMARIEQLEAKVAALESK